MIFLKTLELVNVVVQWTFWTIGYFFGFTLVTVLTFGLLVPDDFSGSKLRDGNSMVFRRHGLPHLSSEAVSLLGWAVLIAFVWLLSAI